MARRLSVSQARKNPATDEDVKVFAELTDLEELELQGETITDAAIGYLVGLPTLHHLSLEDTSITDEGVANLQRLRSLRRLNLSGFRLHDRRRMGSRRRVARPAVRRTARQQPWRRGARASHTPQTRSDYSICEAATA